MSHNSKQFILSSILALLSLTTGTSCRYDQSSSVVSDEPNTQGKQDDIRPRTETFTTEVTDYNPQKSEWDDLLSDDTLDQKKTQFDASLIHPVPIDGYHLNLSNAVIRLDVPMLKPDQDQGLMQLHPSYADALKSGRAYFNSFQPPLPSVNLIDGLAKQFDDGLYAALDQAYYAGLDNTLASHVELVKRIFDKLDAGSPATPFLGASLQLAGQKVDKGDAGARQRYLQSFESDPVASKPIGFYTWNPKLEQCFRFMRFLQKALEADSPIVADIGRVLASDSALASDYTKANAFYAKLTNPMKRGPIPVNGATSATKEVSVFPPSTSREGELIMRLFPLGLPADANLMRELITRIRSGEVDLTPRDDSGWYDRQVYALETMLLPERGAESNKLMLTKGYKRRMLEAFQALITKRRETHVRQLDIPRAAAAAPPRRDLKVAPPLRIEPAATYYLRTARAYAFLANFLESTVGPEALKPLHGLRKDGPREKDLWTELHDMRDLFYGFYLTSCDDTGLKPELQSSETVDEARSRTLVADWLGKPWQSDPDLAIDTRVSVPIYYDPNRKITRLWVTLGVRLSRLETSFARGPSVKPVEGEGEWAELDGHQLQGKTFYIAVDEFAEVELKGARTLTRDELRALCDKHKTKAAILKALQE